jgi:hypothetical protein
VIKKTELRISPHTERSDTAGGGLGETASANLVNSNPLADGLEPYANLFLKRE